MVLLDSIAIYTRSTIIEVILAANCAVVIDTRNAVIGLQTVPNCAIATAQVVVGAHQTVRIVTRLAVSHVDSVPIVASCTSQVVRCTLPTERVKTGLADMSGGWSPISIACITHSVITKAAYTMRVRTRHTLIWYTILAKSGETHITSAWRTVAIVAVINLTRFACNEWCHSSLGCVICTRIADLPRIANLISVTVVDHLRIGWPKFYQ